jgi:hypothetical protein
LSRRSRRIERHRQIHSDVREFGTHHGLPVTIVATTTLEDLQNKTGMAHTGGDTLLPVRDLIRMAAHAYNYLLIFDEAKKCQL